MRLLRDIVDWSMILAAFGKITNAGVTERVDERSPYVNII
jgi:hypothetical protein